jgi:hypothetical protein
MTFSICNRLAASITTARTLFSENLPDDSVNRAAWGVASGVTPDASSFRGEVRARCGVRRHPRDKMLSNGTFPAPLD